jgi:hypothetical protein
MRFRADTAWAILSGIVSTLGHASEAGGHTLRRTWRCA